RTYLSIFFSLVIICFIWSCNFNKANQVETETNSGNEFITISKDQATILGLEFGHLRNINITSGISVNGYFATPPENTAFISSNVSGKVIRVNFQIGEKVKKGSEVVCVESIEFLEIQRDYIATKSSLKYLEDEYERQKKLADQNVNARKVFLRAEKDYLESKAQLESLKKKLEILRVSTENLENGNLLSQLSIKSPIEGYISEVNTITGETVDNETILIKVVNPEHMHVEFDVFEKDIMHVHVGQKVELSIPNAPQIQMLGDIILIGKEIDEDTRSVKVHAHFPDNQNLYVGMFVQGKILTEESEKMAIPEQGLLREEKRSYVYKLLSENDSSYSLKRELVAPGPERDGLVVLNFLSDIDSNDMFAINGVYYLSSDLEVQ
ncbi:MAG: efflux RND transporter periplasmic adaptor subunit, partial [Cyclobacteriaceae bacterium]